MAELVRTTELFVTKETTENTPVKPSAGNEAIALRDGGFSDEPNQETLENDSIKASIGMSAPQLGVEDPSVSLSTYLKHSGAEGTAPETDYFLESLMGSVATRSTERDTVSGSTTAVVNVDSGEGAEFQRGDAVLLKDSTNGYSIRNVKSVSGDALTLGQSLASAPASGVNLGRNTVYRPANSGHPTLSWWLYRGDGAASTMVSGVRVTEMSMSAEANAQVTADYSAQGLKYHFNPIVIDADDIYLDFTDSLSAAKSCQVTAKTYKDPHELASALETAMNGAGGADTYTVTWNDKGAAAGKYTIASDASPFSLDWNTGTNTANTIGDAIGFSVGADDTGAQTYTSDSVISWASSVTPSFDSSDALVAKNNELILSSDTTDTSCLHDGVKSVSITVSTEKNPVDNLCAETGRDSSVPTGRTVTADVVAILDKDDALAFKDYRANSDVSMVLNLGSKTAGNWDAGKCVNMYMVQGRITSYALEDDEGIWTLSLSVQAHVAGDGLGEFYINFV